MDVNNSRVPKFLKRHRLLKRYQFKRMFTSSKEIGEWLILRKRQNGLSFTRLGITVTTKFGKAYLRNRFKRRLREAFRLSYTTLPSGLDIEVRPRKCAENATLHQIQTDLDRLIRQEN